MAKDGLDGGPSVAVIGAGAAGLSCAWLLSRRRRVTLFDAADWIGGHAHTVEAPGRAGAVAVDTGFIVYNAANYPNFTALLAHLGVATKPADMSFAVSIDDGALEYGSRGLSALFAQPANLARPRFWSMIGDLIRFYREAPRALAELTDAPLSLGELLDRGGYGRAFQEDHILPQVGAIWSMSPAQARDFPAEAMIRFFANHGLLQLGGRPQWRTVAGGSRAYVRRLIDDLGAAVRPSCPVFGVRRDTGGVWVRSASGLERFDEVVLAVHADQALKLLEDARPQERAVLGAFRYADNAAYLHADPSLMPRRRRAWSSWNHIGRRDDPRGFCVSYWMNQLQGLDDADPLFVTLNPSRPPSSESVVGRYVYAHPLFDAPALQAQKQLWSLQGQGGLWFCGAHFGSGFHEDAIQSGLAVAEQLSGVRRPWRVENESGRITLGPAPSLADQGLAA